MKAPNPAPDSPSAAPFASGAAPLAETRYSLRDMLAEVEFERQHSTLGLEMVDQTEIGTIFKRRGGRRAAAKSRAR